MKYIITLLFVVIFFSGTISKENNTDFYTYNIDDYECIEGNCLNGLGHLRIRYDVESLKEFPDIYIVYYKGNFSNGKFEGKGVLFYVNPQMVVLGRLLYLGYFKANKLYGRGTLFLDNGRFLRDGFYKNNKYIGKRWVR